MKKQKVLKIIALSGLISVLFISSAFGAYKYNQYRNFNNLVNLASQKLYSEDYDNAIKLYNQALSYKNNNNIKAQMLLAQNCKQNQNIYNDGLKLMNSEEYSKAIEKFSIINKNTGQIYTNSQNKIEECKKNIISQNLKAANNSIENEDYDTANNYVSNILKIDNKNEQAIKLKEIIAKGKEEKSKNYNNETETAKLKELNSNKNNYENSKQLQAIEDYKVVQEKINEIDIALKRQHYITESLPVGSEKRRASMLQIIELEKQKIRVYEDARNKLQD